MSQVYNLFQIHKNLIEYIHLDKKLIFNKL